MHAANEIAIVNILIRTAMAAFAMISPDAFGASDDTPVIIGAMYNLTGGQQNLDIPSSQGARLAVDMANAGDSVLGRRVDMILVDGETRPEIIAGEARRLFRDHPAIAGLIGFSDTDMVLAAAAVAAQHGRVFLTPARPPPCCPSKFPNSCSSPASETMFRPRPGRNGLTMR